MILRDQLGMRRISKGMQSINEDFDLDQISSVRCQRMLFGDVVTTTILVSITNQVDWVFPLDRASERVGDIVFVRGSQNQIILILNSVRVGAIEDTNRL